MRLFSRYSAVMLLSLIMTWGVCSSAVAQDAEVIFNRCKMKIQEITQRTTNAQTETVRTCAPIITELLAQGNNEEAHRVARRCLATVDEITAAGTQNLRRTCRECVEMLRRLNAIELAERLTNLCEASIRKLNEQQRRARRLIEELF